MQVSESHNVITQASQPQYPVSPPITVSIGQARHLVAYGPYCSLDVAHSFFPYSPGSGQTYHSQNYGFNLANGCPVIHPLSSPEASGCSRSDYFSSLQDLKTPAADLYERFLATLSGLGHGHGFDQHAEELYAELQANRVRLLCSVRSAALAQRLCSCNIVDAIHLSHLASSFALRVKHERFCIALLRHAMEQ